MVKKYSKKIRPKIKVFELYQTTFYSTPYETFTGKSSKIKLVKLSDIKKEIQFFRKNLTKTTHNFFSVIPSWNEEKKTYTLTEDDLEHFKEVVLEKGVEQLKQNLGIKDG